MNIQVFMLGPVNIYMGGKAAHLYWIEAHRAEAFHTPAEGADGSAPLLIPDVNGLATGGKCAVLLMMIETGENRL